MDYTVFDIAYALCWLVDSQLQWCHNEHHGVSNHHPHGCLLNRVFRRRSKKTSKLRVTDLCVGNSPMTGEFPAQMASNAENVSIWWRHHVMRSSILQTTCIIFNEKQSVLGHHLLIEN